MKTMTKSRSYDQHQLKVLCDALCENIEDVLSYFNLEYKISSKMVIMKCPIHCGDNESALNLYHQGDQYKGNWVCRTHGCEKVFKKSILGFIRGILSNKKYDWSENGDQTVTFRETIELANKLVGIDLSDIKLSNEEQNKNTFSNIIKHLSTFNDENQIKIDAQLIRKSLNIPADYYISRGYSSSVLNKYDIGICNTSGKEMYQRAVAPIYDADHKYMIGCSGRSVFEKCDKCKSFHDPNNSCPSVEEAWKFSKWKHSSNFKSQNCLYNFWFAKEYIMQTTTAIIVESPGNVWRLEEAGFHNSVAIFGSTLSDKQKILLDGSGAMNLILLTDNDEAGEKAAEQIIQKCHKTYKVYRPILEHNDIACMSPDSVKTFLQPILESIT